MASRSFFRRHPILSVFLLLLLLIAGAAVYFFQTTSREELIKQGKTYVEPDLQSTKTIIEEITADSLKGKLMMRVRNSLPIAIQVDSLSYKVTLNGDTVSRGYDGSGIRIAANSNDEVTMLIQADIRSFYKQAQKLEADSANVGIHAVLHNQFPLVGYKAFPVNFTKRIPIPRLPKVEVEGVDFSDLNLNGGKMQVKLKVTNYSAMSYTINGFSYRFRMSNNIDMEGKSRQKFNFPKKGTETLTIPADIDLNKAGDAALKILFLSDDTPYTFSGNMHMTTENAGLRQFDIAFQHSGTMKELKNKIKAPTPKNQ